MRKEVDNIASEVGDLYVLLRAVTEPFVSSMQKAGAESERTAGGLGKIPPAFVAISAATVAAGVAAVVMANQFQTMYTRLYTQAGASKQSVLDSRDAMLALGTATGFTGTQIANALYHPVSTGYDLATSLKIVAASAKEAQISGASLDDTTYSLSSVMKAFGFSADQAVPTMAKLNAIVGQGDMRFQDFNLSIKNWAPVAAAMGMSIESMGSGLAYLTDRGMRADEASTRLTMGISMMSTPVKQAKTLLEGMGLASDKVSSSSAAMTEVMKRTGITNNQLAADLKKPDGLYVALTDLKARMDSLKIPASEQESILGKLFGGGKSDKAILSLWQNLDQLKVKYDAVVKSSSPKTFAQAWADASATTKVQFDKLKASFDNFLISVGEKLLPAVNKFMGILSKVFDFITTHKEAMLALAAIIGGILVASLTAATVAFIAFLTAGGPIVWILAGIAAVAIEIVTHWETVKKVFMETFDWIKDHEAIVSGALIAMLGPIGLIAAAALYIGTHWKQVTHDVAQWWHDLTGEAKKVAGDISKWWSISTEAAKQVWSEVTGWLSSTWDSITGIWDKTGGKAITWISTQWQWLSGNLTQIWGELVQLWNATGGRLVSFISDNWNAIRGGTSTAWNAITGVLRTAWNAIMTVVRPALDIIKGIVQAGWDTIKFIFQTVWGVIKTVVQVAWDLIVGLLKIGMDVLKTAFQVGWDIIKAVFTVTWNTIKSALQVIFDTIKGILQVFIDFFTGRWGKLWGDVKNTATSIWNTISGYFTTIMGTIKNTVVTMAGQIWTGFTNAIYSAMLAIYGALRNIWQEVVNFFAGAGQWLWNAGWAIIQGLLNGIKSAFNDVKNFVSGIASTIANLKGPLPKDRGLLIPHGMAIMQGLLEGISSQKGALVGVMKDITGIVGLDSPEVSMSMTGHGLPPSTVAALSAAGNHAGGGTQIILNIAGNVLSENELRDFIQKATLQGNARNSNNGLVYARGG